MKLLFVLFAFAVLHECRQWDERNDPTIFGNFDFNTKSLGLGAQLTKIPWSDTYWPSYQSGIAHRWYLKNAKDFQYDLYSKDQLKRMDSTKLSSLSPAEKFDIYTGRYDYPTVHSEWSRTSPYDQDWEGLCHGWAPASIYYDQPNPVIMTNQDGITIPFGSSDVKALLTYYLAEYDEANSPTKFIADRCKIDLKKDPSKSEDPSCADMNAATLHIIATNQLRRKGFIIDRDRSIQVWNQPVWSFNSSIINTRDSVEGAAPGTTQQIQVHSSLTYVKETAPHWEAHPSKLVTEEYKYWLELDEKGDIKGGEYESWDRPDFAWYLAEGASTNFRDYFHPLAQIYASSLNQTAPPALLRGVGSVGLIGGIKPQNVQTMNQKTQEFGIKNVPNSFKRAWSIIPDNARRIRMEFTEFSTERYRDKVKVYEGAFGQGALIAVLHGKNSNGSTLIINSPAALVVFTTDESETSEGFIATYFSIE